MRERWDMHVWGLDPSDAKAVTRRAFRSRWAANRWARQMVLAHGTPHGAVVEEARRIGPPKLRVYVWSAFEPGRDVNDHLVDGLAVAIAASEEEARGLVELAEPRGVIDWGEGPRVFDLGPLAFSVVGDVLADAHRTEGPR